MTPRIVIAAAALALVFATGWRVGDWRHASLDRMRQNTTIEQLEAELRVRDHDAIHQSQINAYAEKAYINKARKSDDELRSVRDQLRAVQLRKRACPAVPAATHLPEPARSVDAAGEDDLSSGLAERAGDRFAECDHTAAQLNGLQDWLRATTAKSAP